MATVGMHVLEYQVTVSAATAHCFQAFSILLWSPTIIYSGLGTQDGTQPAAKGQPNLCIGLNLV